MSGNSPWRRPATPQLLTVGGAVVYSLIAADTTPFTIGADLATALPLVAFVAAVVVSWYGPRRVRAHRPSRAQVGHPYRPWVVLYVVFVAWELFNYLARGSRASHPTFSSMTDAVDRFYGLKALLFLVWLTLGWTIVRLGSGRASAAAAVVERAP